MNLPAVPHHKTLLLLAAAILTTPAVADEKSSTPITSLRPGKALTADELALLFDAQVWKLHVDRPPGAKTFSMGFEIQERGKKRQAWGGGLGGLILPGSGGEVLVAIIPVGGTLNDADKVRVVKSAFGTTSKTTVDNPFKSLGIGRPGIPEDLKDGSFNLIGGYSGRVIGSPVSSADTAISLRITTSETR
jgi:hypothetical protein